MLCHTSLVINRSRACVLKSYCCVCKYLILVWVKTSTNWTEHIIIHIIVHIITHIVRTYIWASAFMIVFSLTAISSIPIADFNIIVIITKTIPLLFGSHSFTIYFNSRKSSLLIRTHKTGPVYPQAVGWIKIPAVNLVSVSEICPVYLYKWD